MLRHQHAWAPYALIAIATMFTMARAQQWLPNLLPKAFTTATETSIMYIDP